MAFKNYLNLKNGGSMKVQYFYAKKMTFKMSFFLLMLILCLLGCEKSPKELATLSDVDLAAIEKADNDYIETMRSSDFQSLKDLFSDNIVLLPPGRHPLKDISSINEFMSAFKVTEIQLRNTKITGSGNLGYRTAEYTMRFILNDSPDERSYHGKWLTVYRKQLDGTWKIETDIWNRSPSP